MRDRRPAFHQRRRGGHDARDLRELERHHRGVVDLADLDRAVDVLGDEVGTPVVQQPFDVDARVLAQVAVQRMHQQVLPERMRRDHAQRALGRAAGAAQLVLERGPVGQQFLRAREAALAVLGELHAVGGAPQQAQPERALERLQAPAHGGLAHAELGRGGRQAAGLDDADEGLHELDAVGRGGGRENGGRFGSGIRCHRGILRLVCVKRICVVRCRGLPFERSALQTPRTFRRIQG